MSRRTLQTAKPAGTSGASTEGPGRLRPGWLAGERPSCPDCTGLLPSWEVAAQSFPVLLIGAEVLPGKITVKGLRLRQQPTCPWARPLLRSCAARGCPARRTAWPDLAGGVIGPALRRSPPDCGRRAADWRRCCAGGLPPVRRGRPRPAATVRGPRRARRTPAMPYQSPASIHHPRATSTT
jgi:hypothetical protein